jgi:hypothetical protein
MMFRVDVKLNHTLFFGISLRLDRKVGKPVPVVLESFPCYYDSV